VCVSLSLTVFVFVTVIRETEMGLMSQSVDCVMGKECVGEREKRRETLLILFLVLSSSLSLSLFPLFVPNGFLQCANITEDT
jgi:hypothetical protein